MLPPITGGRLTDNRLRAWLMHSDLERVDGRRELLQTVLAELGTSIPTRGLAALRMWGQTGNRPTHWVAAADPVYLEPQLDKLCLHAVRRDGIAARELRALLEHLQATLANDGSIGFMRLGSYGYISAKAPFPTADMPAYVVDQADPGAHFPASGDTARHRSLLSEIEMALHDHEVNQAREADGKPPVNSLWLWGGGEAPPEDTRVQPPLFSDDALLNGFWASGKGVCESWPGTIAACLEYSVAGFVAETPEFVDDPALLQQCLTELREALRSRRLDSLTLLFRDGVRARVERAHALRIWRRDASVLD